ncbi:MAG: SUMF1/EgtB/PvdO family nonheme iron enzyme, partial [Treponema sp.]|nr:SUMF1/EgtB/PvdO family nonheme iron enzyme [Treponema sp.]
LTTKNEMTGGQVRYTRPVIVEQPQEKVLEIKGGDDPYFKFTSKSGKTFVFGEESIDDPLPQTYSLDFDWDSSQGDYECPLENFLPAGEEVYFTVTPDSGYRIKSVTVKYSSGDDLNSELESDGSGYYRFTMPEQDVCVAIEFELIPPPNDFIYVQGGGTISPGNTAYSDSEVLVSGTYIPNFYMCEHEVTQAEYQEYCCYSGSSPNTLWADLNYPATYINWYSAIVYCNLRSMAENRTPVYSLNGETNPALWNDKTEGTGEYVGKYAGPSTNIDTWNNIEMDSSANGYRLPTEAEWEYAARGGMQADPYAYSGSDTPSEVAVYDVSDFAPSQVKSKNANSIGIYDMSGNVAEWTWDTSDGGTNRYFRGGSFSTTIEDFLKVNKRLYQPPYNGNSTQGFRVVLNAD